MAGDVPALERIIQGTEHARATLGMTVCVAGYLISQPRLTPAQRDELLDSVHAGLVDQLFASAPGHPASDLEEALAAILREGG